MEHTRHSFGASIWPGEVAALKRGTHCDGTLTLQGSGSAEAIVRLTAYGEGPRPANRGRQPCHAGRAAEKFRVPCRLIRSISLAETPMACS